MPGYNDRCELDGIVCLFVKNLSGMYLASIYD